MFQEVVLDAQWSFWSEEAEHTGIRIWMSENSVSGVFSAGNPLGSEAPCHVQVWRLLRAPRVKPAAPLRRNIYYNITEMTQNLQISVLWGTKSTH